MWRRYIQESKVLFKVAGFADAQRRAAFKASGETPPDGARLQQPSLHDQMGTNKMQNYLSLVLHGPHVLLVPTQNNGTGED